MFYYKNVTDVEQAKNDLESKNKELSQFAYMVAHDLKDPLNSLSGLINILMEQYKDKLDDQATELFDLIANTSNRMTRLITDLLDYSSVGQLKGITTVSCHKLIKELQQDLAVKIKESNTSISVGDLPVVEGYETELRMLFQNLISNAIKFCKPGVKPKIKLSSKEKEDAWVFYVKDNGIGIKGSNKEKIFNVLPPLACKK